MHPCQKLYLLTLVTTIGILPATAQQTSSDPVVEVSGESIIVPTPEGFDRIDGILPEFDEMAQGFLPPTNKLLINFGSPADRAALEDIESGVHPTVTRSFNIQVMGQFENKNISAGDFIQIVQATKNELAGFDMNKALAELADQGNETIGDVAGEKGDVSLSMSTGVGVLEEGESFLTFGMELNAASGGETDKAYVVASLVRLHGKLLNLYVTSIPSTPDNRSWAQDGMRKWRDDLLTKNTTLAVSMAMKPPSKIRLRGSQETGIGKITGIVVGIAVTLLAVNWIKNRKRPS